MENFRGDLFGFKLECQSPPGAAGNCSEGFLKPQRVNLDYHAVDFKRELLPKFIHLPVEFEDLLDSSAPLPVRIYFETPVMETLEQFPVSFERLARDLAHSVAIDVEGPFCRDG
jgi:hypothetical protein